MNKIGVILCLALISLQSQAQKSPENHLGTWYMYNGVHQLSNEIKLTTSAHVRYFELATEYQQEIYRVGFNYSFSKNINATFGSVYSITDVSYQENASDLYEFRLYQDLNIKDAWNKMKVNHRFRLAQRFKRQNFKNETQHRIRYGLFLKYPITKNWEAYAFNEIFMKFASSSFDQNRTGAGFFKKIDKNLTLRLGYFYTKFSNTYLHRLQLGIILNTNFTNKNS